MSYSDSERKEIISDHHMSPRGKGIPEGYRTILLKNVSCGDIIAVGADIDDHVKDIRHQGTGCSICCASASMMCELLKGKSVEDAKSDIKEFEKMMTRQPFDADALGDAAALEGVNKLLPRIKCATLAWKAADKLLGGETGEKEDD